ncbi:MAG: dual specificity protein phosphatase family protein [Anaerolineales bacterium]|jgi:protein tyrosine/serine phosphatase
MNNHNKHPLPESYWVIPGKLIAGAYPASKYFEEQTRQKLDTLLTAGVSFFLNLTREGEMPPYEQELGEIAGWLEKPAEHRRMTIPDMTTPDPAYMAAILDTIDEAVKDGKVVYVHCYAGIGRTGTVVGCYLTRHGMDGAEALNTIALLRSSTPNGWVRSPETDEQVEYVLNWKKGM